MSADLGDGRIVVAVVILLAIMMTTLVAIRSAGAVEFRKYAGRTSQATEIHFVLVKRSDGSLR